MPLMAHLYHHFFWHAHYECVAPNVSVSLHIYSLQNVRNLQCTECVVYRFTLVCAMQYDNMT